MVSETTLVGNRPPAEGHRGAFLENTAITRDMTESADLVMDVQTLLGKGYSDNRIAEELEVDPAVLADLLVSLRQRRQDGI